MISLGLILLSLFIFINLKRETQFLIFSIIVFYPFTYGRLKSIPDLLIMEWLTPVFFLILLNDLSPVNKAVIRRPKIIYRGLEIFILALIVLVIWTFHSYLTHEILADVTQGGTARFYYKIILNILMFFTVIFFFSQYYEDFDIEQWLKVLIAISVVIGVVRIITFFLSINIPVLAGTFKYNPGAIRRFGGIAFRIGGLSRVTEVGLGALFALNYLTGKNRLFLIITFFVFVFMSGGRTLMIGFVAAVMVYSMFFYKRNIFYFLVVAGLAIILLLIFAPEKFIEGQLARITAFSGGLQQQSKERYTAWMMQYRNFMNNPFWGIGVTPYEGYIHVTNPKFIERIRAMLSLGGGHGSYISILGTFGIGGIFYLLTMTLGGIILAFKKVRLYMEEDAFLAALAIFVLINLIIKSVYYTTAFNGISDPSLFLVVGIIASVKIIENRMEYEEFEDDYDNEEDEYDDDEYEDDYEEGANVI